MQAGLLPLSCGAGGRFLASFRPRAHQAPFVVSGFQCPGLPGQVLMSGMTCPGFPVRASVRACLPLGQTGMEWGFLLAPQTSMV